ncbi:MAG: hypothetical protein ACRDTV_15830 [Mycobacterium sp.]
MTDDKESRPASNGTASSTTNNKSSLPDGFSFREWVDTGKTAKEQQADAGAVFNVDDWIDGRTQRPAPRLAARTATPQPSDHNQKRAHGIIDAACATMAAMPPNSGRQHASYHSTYMPYRYALWAGLNLDDVTEQFFAAFVANGEVAEEGEHKMRDTLGRARADAERDGPEEPTDRDTYTYSGGDGTDFDPGPAANGNGNGNGDDRPAAAPLDITGLEADFWQRDSLRTIYDAALARMVAPWAVLAHCAARVLAYVPTNVTLPPLIGGDRGGSLNWYAVTLDRSGGGKSAAADVAASLIPYSAQTRHVGSGEGLIECYWPAFKPPKEGEEDLANNEPRAFIFHVDEIDTLGAVGARSGSTLLPHLCTAFTGGSLGNGYRGRTDQIIPAQEYRLTLVVAAQPARCANLLAGAASGTPQRFMWFPANDRRITVANARPMQPIGALHIAAGYSRITHIEIPDEVTQHVLEQREANAQPGRVAAISGHAVFCREKFAYALAVMDGRVRMSGEDWRLSGIAAAVSDATREYAAAEVARAADDEAAEKGRRTGVTLDASDTTRANLAADRAARIGRWVLDKLKAEPATAGALRRAAGSRDRPYIDGALQRLQAAELVTLDGKTWGRKP